MNTPEKVYLFMLGISKICLENLIFVQFRKFTKKEMKLLLFYILLVEVPGVVLGKKMKKKMLFVNNKGIDFLPETHIF